VRARHDDEDDRLREWRNRLWGRAKERDGEWGAGAAEKGMRMEILREEEPADHAPCRSFSGSVQVLHFLSTSRSVQITNADQNRLIKITVPFDLSFNKSLKSSVVDPNDSLICL